MTDKQLNDDLNTNDEDSRDYAAIMIRLLYTLLFAILGWLSLWVLAAVIVLQFGFWIFSGEKNQQLQDFASKVTIYIKSILDFMSLQNEEKPFPFAKWPEQKTVQTEPDV